MHARRHRHTRENLDPSASTQKREAAEVDTLDVSAPGRLLIVFLSASLLSASLACSRQKQLSTSAAPNLLPQAIPYSWQHLLQCSVQYHFHTASAEPNEVNPLLVAVAIKAPALAEL